MLRPPSVLAAATDTGTPTGTPGVDGPVDDAAQSVVDFLGTNPGRILLAALVLIVGWYLSAFVVRYLGRSMARRFRRPSVARTVLGGIRVGLLFGTVLVALWVLEIGLGNIVISVTVFSAVLGLVLAPIIGSVVNGLFLLADQPYEVGDLIEIPDLHEGTLGFVEDITIRYTKVFTLDNSFLVVPNSSMRERDVVNYSAEDERTRMTLRLLVTYESDVEAGRRIMERAARDVDEVITGGPDIRIGSARYPAGPTCYIEEFANHGILLTLRFWAKQPYKQLAVKSRVNERVWSGLEDSEVVVAYPHQHLVFDETSGEVNVRMNGPGEGPPGGSSRGGSGPGGDGPGGGGRGRSRPDENSPGGTGPQQSGGPDEPANGS